MLDVSFEVQPEGYEQIKDDRRPQGNKGKVNEIKAHPGRCYADFLSQIAANAECRAF